MPESSFNMLDEIRNINSGFVPKETKLPETAGYTMLDEVRKIAAGDFSQTKTPAPIKPEKPRGVLAETASALAAGVVSTGEAGAGMAEMVGVPGAETARKYLQELNETEPLKRPDYLQDDTIRLNDWRWWVRNLGENIPNFALMMGTGVVGGVAAKAAGLGMKAIGRTAVASGLGSNFVMEGGSAYSQAKQEMEQTGQYDEKTIERIATAEGLAVGTANTLLEWLPMDNLFLKQAGADRLLKRIVRQAILEGTTEQAQEAVNILAEKLGHKPDQQWSDQVNRILTSGIVGGVMGGAAGGTIGAHVHKKNVSQYNALAENLQLTDDIKGWKAEGLSDTEIAGRVNERIQNVRSAQEDINADIPDEKKMGHLPEINADEMTSYVLYGEGKFTPEPGLVSQKAAQAKAGVFRMFGMKSKTEGGMSTGAQSVTDAGKEAAGQNGGVADAGKEGGMVDTTRAAGDIGRAPASEEKIKRQKGEDLFATALSDLNAENQAKLEQTRLSEIARQEAAEQQAAAAEQQAAQAQIVQAVTQRDELRTQLAGDDLKKQGLFDETMALSEKRLASAIAASPSDKKTPGLGLALTTDDRGLYQLNGQPVDIETLRPILAQARIQALDMQREQAIRDAESRMQMEIQSRLAKNLSLARKMLPYWPKQRPSESDLLILQDAVAQGKLSEDEQAILGKILKTPEQKKTMPASVQTLGMGIQQPPPASSADVSAPFSVIPAKAGIQSEEVTENPEYQQANDLAEQEEKKEKYLLSLMKSQLENAGTAQLVETVDGSYTRIPVGVDWLTDVNKQGIKVSKEEALTVIRKAENNATMTDKQEDVYDAIIQAAKQRIPDRVLDEPHWIQKGFELVRGGELAARDLVEGDRFVIGGEEFTVTDIDDEGNITLKDGTIRKIKDGAVIKGVDYLKQAEGETEFDAASLAPETPLTQDTETELPFETKTLTDTTADYPDLKPEAQKAEVPASVQALTGIKTSYHKNYNRLAKLFKKWGLGKPEDFREHAKLATGSKSIMDLNVEYLRDDKDGNCILALSHYYKQHGDLVPDPDMEIRVTKDGMVEALTFQDYRSYDAVYPEEGKVNLKLKKDLNNFLGKWLKNIEDQGHMPKKAEEKAGPKVGDQLTADEFDKLAQDVLTEIKGEETQTEEAGIDVRVQKYADLAEQNWHDVDKLRDYEQRVRSVAASIALNRPFQGKLTAEQEKITEQAKNEGDRIARRITEIEAEKKSPLKKAREEDPYMAAVGEIAGKADRAIERGYEFAYGETKKNSDTYWDMVGMFSGTNADKLFAAGITIKKKAETQKVTPAPETLTGGILANPEAQNVVVPKYSVTKETSGSWKGGVRLTVTEGSHKGVMAFGWTGDQALVDLKHIIWQRENAVGKGAFIVSSIPPKENVTTTKPATTLGHYGLTVTKGTTNTGKTVWNISGPETRTWKENIKQAGGRWYGPKKVWSFYDADPTEKLLKVLPPIENVHPEVRHGYPEKAPPKEEAPKPSLKTAADEAMKGFDASLDAVAELLKNVGKNRNTLSMFGGGVFNEKVYEAVKPHLVEAYNHFKTAGREVKEWVMEVIRSLKAKGVPPDVAMVYVKHFYMNDVPALTKTETGATLESTEGGKSHGEETGEIPGRESAQGTLLGMAGAPGLDAGESSGKGTGAVRGERTEGVSGQEGKSRLEKDQLLHGEGEDLRGSEGNRKQRPPVAPERAGIEAESPGTAPGETGTRNPDLGGEPAKRAGNLHRGLTNHRIEPEDVLFHSGKQARINANIRAIQLSKQLEDEKRPATPEEKKVLQQFTGWGAVAQEVFNDQFDEHLRKKAKRGHDIPFYGSDETARKYQKWETDIAKKLHPALNGLFTEEQWQAAAESTLNAHYTSRDVIEHGLWGAARQLGFKDGTVLEPAAGIGHILGLMPADYEGHVRLMGVELDPVSGRILSQLYPKAPIQVTGFEKAKGITDNSVDLVISNFPFGDYPIIDKAHPEYSGWSVHNYFFARSVDSLKPGGIVIAITSRYTMDSTKNAKIREYLAGKADLVAAIRLPNTAFKENAGTEVTTDIIILRKKTAENYPERNEWRHVLDAKTDDDKPIIINEYFIQHPEMVLGKNSLHGSMYGKGKEEYTVEPTTSLPLNRQLLSVVNRLPRNIAGEGSIDAQEIRLAKTGTKEGLLVYQDGSIYHVNNGLLTTPDWIKEKNKRVQASYYIPVRDTANELIKQMQNPGATDQDIAALQRKLDSLYTSYLVKYGHFNSPASRFLGEDVEFPVAMSLENVISKPVQVTVKSGKYQGQTRTVVKKSFVKADIFTKRTLYPFIEPETAQSLEDALHLSLTYRNSIAPQYMATLLGKDWQAVREELIDSGLAFFNPANGLVETRSEYLSGNVREKLRRADAEGLEKNVKSLTEVLPKDLTIDEIYFRLGSEWIPADIVNTFMQEVMGTPAKAVMAKVSAGDDGFTRWHVNDPHSHRRNDKHYTVWGAERLSGPMLLEDCLNLHRTEIYDVFEEDGKTKRVKNQVKSLTAQAKQREIQTAFKEWTLQNGEASKTLTEIYNRDKNNYVVRHYDVPEIEHYPNASHLITLRPHQKAAVSRGLQGSTIYAHAVGTGKTYMYSTLAMELRRTGQARKPLIVVQGSTVNQFAGQAKQLYPAARILCPTKKDRTKSERRALLSRIATNDYDMIILPHSFFDDLNINPAREEAYIREQLDEIKMAILSAGGDLDNQKRNDNPTVKELRRMLKRKEARMEELKTSPHGIDTIWFDDLGVDAILTDEAHHYKRGDFYTKMGNVKGLDRGAAAKSFRFLLKCRGVQEKTNFKNIYLATGTPVSNTTAELWTLLRYVRPDLLAEFGAEQFDGFAAIFGDTTRTLEMTETGDFKDVERFNRYVNGPELIKMWLTAADVILQEDVPGWAKMVPKLKNDTIESVPIPRTDAVAAFITWIREQRAEWDKLTGAEKREQSHVPLLLFNKAKQAAIDLRLVQPQTGDDPGSKTNRVVSGVFQRWEETTELKGTQVIFVDTYKGPNGFNLYHDIRDKLIARGVPNEEITVITDNKYTTDAAKEALFDRANQGDVRILIGSTAKLGIGVNVQERLVAIHHVDAPMRPMDFEQRNGRILRPGNTNVEAEILAYAVINTLDSVTYDRLQKKQKFINQLLRGNIEGRTFEDPADELQFTFEDLMAASAGNPLVKKRFELENRIRELSILEDGYRRKIGNLRTQIRNNETALTFQREGIEKAEAKKAETERDFPDTDYRITLNGQTYEDAKEGKKALTIAVEEGAARARKAYEKVMAELENREKNPTDEDLSLRKLRQEPDYIIPSGWAAMVGNIGETINGEINGRPLVITIRPVANQQVFAKKIADIKDDYALMYGYEIDPKTTRTKDYADKMMDIHTTFAGVQNLRGGLDGIFTSLHAALKKNVEAPAQRREQIAQAEKNLATMHQEIVKPFEFTGELEKLRNEHRTVLTELGAVKAPSAADEAAGETEAPPDVQYSVAEEQRRHRYRGAEITTLPSEDIGEEPGSEAQATNHAAIMRSITDSPWKWTAKDLIELKNVEEIRNKLDKIFGPDVEFDEWRDGGGKDIKRHYVAFDHQGDLEYAARERNYEETGRILKKIQKRLKSQDYYIYEQAVQSSGGKRPAPETGVPAGTGEVSPAERKPSSNHLTLFKAGEAPPLRLSEPHLKDLVTALAKTVKGLKTAETEGRFYIETKNGHYVRIMAVEYIEADTVALKLGYGDEKANEKPRISGAYYSTKTTQGYTVGDINLVLDASGAWTLSHEFYHFLEDIGAISNTDKLILNNKISAIMAKDPATWGYLSGRKLSEARADWVGKTLAGMYDAKTPTGKIVQKIRDFIDTIINALGIRTSGGVIRDIKSGKVFEEGSRGKVQNEVQGSRFKGQGEESSQYALEDTWKDKAMTPAAKQASRGVAMLTGKLPAQYREILPVMKKHWNEFWKPFSTVPDGDKVLAKRYEAMGNVAKAVRYIEQIHDRLDAFPDEVKKDMFWYLNGDIPIETLPEDARELAQLIQRRTQIIGEMLVDRGILSESQFKKYAGKYIHYMYAKHIMGEDAPVFLTSTGKLNLTYTKSRNPNLTMQQRKELGLIEDASVAVPVGMGKALTDIAKYDYLAKIAENADWVWQPSMVRVPSGKPLAEPIKGRTRRYRTMGIGKLVEEVKIYNEMVQKHPSPEVEEIHKILTEALAQAEQQSENMPDDFVQLPNSKGYGMLAGAFVRKPIADDLKPILDLATDRGKLLNTILAIQRQGMASFKMGKVALNFPTAVRNIVSNIIQNNMRGRPLSKIPDDIIAACESMKAKDQYHEEAFGMGIFSSNWFVTEINDVLEEFRKARSGRIDQVFMAIKNVAKYYGKIDDINKLAIYIQMRKEGVGIDEATLEAMKWGMDYSLSSRSVKGLRQTIVPFITYQYKIAPNP
jgi:N12 class adenine-specific DNA methylase/uncharacterized protein YqiB (DUF1249 family)